MDTMSLQHFRIVAELEHMTKAAEVLNISQPALSNSIKRLEEELGIQLFNRKGKKIILNEYGKIYLKSVQAALNILQQSHREILELRDNEQKNFRIACSMSSTNTRMLEQLMNNGYTLTVSRVPDDLEKALLDEQRLDMVIAVDVIDSERLARTILKERQLSFAVGSKHELAKMGVVTLDKVLQYGFATTDGRFSMINTYSNIYTGGTFQPKITFAGRDSRDVMRAVLTGEYVALVTDNNFKEYPELVPLKVTGFSGALPIYLYWKMEEDKDETMARFRTVVVNYYREH